MITFEVEAARDRAAQGVRESLRRDRGRLPGARSGRLLDLIERRLFDPTLSVRSAIKEAELNDRSMGEVKRILGGPLPSYIRRLRIETAERMLKDGGLRVGHVAAAVGIPVLVTFLQHYKKLTKSWPVSARNSPRLVPDFNYATWNLARRGKLTLEDVQILLKRLDEPSRWERPERPLPKFAEPVAFGHWAQRRSWLNAVEETARAIHRDAEPLPMDHARALRYIARELCNPELSLDGLRADLKIGNTSISSHLVHYLGETIPSYVQKRRIELAFHFLCEFDWTVPFVASLVGLSYKSFLSAFKMHAGECPSDVRLPPDAPCLMLDYGAWSRVAADTACSPALVSSIKAHLCSLHSKTPGKSAPAAPTRLELPGAENDQESSLVDLSAWNEASRAEKASAPEADLEIQEDWEKMEQAAWILEPGQPTKSQREVERFVASTHMARQLYRLREIQCEATVADDLERGEIPPEELWVPWLKVRARQERWRDVTLGEWQSVVDRLVPARLALERWREADAKRRRILRLRPEERADALRAEGADYLLARVCLDVEEYYHRGTPVAFESTELAVKIAESLIENSRSSAQGLGLGRRRSALTDLLALAYARHGNVFRYLGDLHAAETLLGKATEMERIADLGDYPQSQVTWILANLVRDEGKNLQQAEDYISRSISIRSRFDRHLEAQALLTRAEIQRLRRHDEYLKSLNRAALAIDEKRDPALAGIAANNYIYYLVKEGDYEQAARVSARMACPSLPMHRAARFGVEGCVEIAIGNVERAEYLLSESTKELFRLHRPGDARIALLYLAWTRLESEDPQGALEHLQSAGQIARRYDFPEADDILLLAGRVPESLGSEKDTILDLAERAGGCLGPRSTERSTVRGKPS